MKNTFEYPHQAGSTAGGLYLLYANARFLYRVRSRRLTCALISSETKQKLASFHLFGDDYFVRERCVVSLCTTRCEEESCSDRTHAYAVEGDC
jgi:hypothetical protein